MLETFSLKASFYKKFVYFSEWQSEINNLTAVGNVKNFFFEK